jgi:hypothetical protein
MSATFGKILLHKLVYVTSKSAQGEILSKVCIALPLAAGSVQLMDTQQAMQSQPAPQASQK